MHYGEPEAAQTRDRRPCCAPVDDLQPINPRILAAIQGLLATQLFPNWYYTFIKDRTVQKHETLGQALHTKVAVMKKGTTKAMRF